MEDLPQTIDPSLWLAPERVAKRQSQKAILEFLAVRIRNPNTRKAYVSALRRFLGWLDGVGIALEKVEPLHVATYIEAHPGAVPTVQQHLAALRVTFHWLQLSGVVSSNPASNVKGPKLSRQHGKTPILNGDEVKVLFDGLLDIGTPVALRDRALIGVMVFACPRISAVCTMRVEDYLIQGRRRSVRFTDKGGKVREIPCNHRLSDFLEAYLDVADLWGEPKGPLFRVTRGSSQELRPKAMSRHDAYQMVKRRAVLFGLTEKLCNHSFRGTGITLYLQHGGSIEKAQEIAGHASTDTTRLYDRRSQEILQAEVERITF